MGCDMVMADSIGNNAMMKTHEAQRAISRHRGDAIVVGTMSAHFEWPYVTTRPELDFMISVMSKASSLALGLALGKPDRKILLIDGDGSLLMSLGNLVTIVGAGATNMRYFVLDNRCYRCCPPGEYMPNSGNTDYAAIAKGAGFQQVLTLEREEEVDDAMPQIMNGPGPVFVWLKCELESGLPSGTSEDFTSKYVEPRLIMDQFVETLKSI